MVQAYTAIDANINRALEGVRVCEDVLRFIYHMPHAQQCKEIRHQIAQYKKSLSLEMLLHARDVESDQQKFFDIKSELERSSLEDVFAANIHRAMEALRVIEELQKLIEINSDVAIQNLRFSLYQLEKDVVPFIKKQQLLASFSNSLYGIIDSSFVKEGSYTTAAKKMIRGGVTIIQLRMKHEQSAKILEAARSISKICKDNGCVFIINDHPDIAILARADGVHLGQDDLPVKDVRLLLPAHMLIGISTHSYEQAMTAAAELPDYIAVGPIFDTKSKYGDLLTGIGLKTLAKIADMVTVPVVGIGGISLGNISSVKEHGCNSFAVISALFKENQIQENSKQLLDQIKDNNE